MYNKEKAVTLKFVYKGENGKYKMESTFPFFDDLGDDELREIGYNFNQFLTQLGYIRKESFLLMDAVSEEEMCELHDHLMQMRHENADGKQNR